MERNVLSDVSKKEASNIKLVADFVVELRWLAECAISKPWHKPAMACIYQS
ncbi:unnamed protein product [Penicillium camemberti]|uniref:Str. FM013 n=1 Tax=Penicillium camemberti (strain FM 013) TaxID=1429867 RepID=A0A0G4PR82_PENC3|nr:unnamed protein product [Penicillium camemberti]